MKRREFIALIGAVTIVSSNIVFGQQSGHVPRVGVLTGLSEDDPETKIRVEAFRQGLRELGLQDGNNIHVDYRWGAVNPDEAARNAKELIRLNPDVIFAATTPAVAAFVGQTRTIPIVFVQVGDPVGQGFVASLARPGGNMTGFTPYEFSLGGKWLDVLKDIAPQVARVALVFNPDTVPYAGFVHSAEAAASSLAVHAVPAPVRSPSEIEMAIKAFAQEPSGGLILFPDVSTAAHRKRIIELAAEYRLPAVYGLLFFATDGGLVAYGPDSVEPYRRAATYVDRILKGANPGELPVQAPTKYELIINVKTAKALGLTVPPSLLAQADEIIE
jgi:putative tryptophan/tyrosine transport system substrate-binding protein